MAALRGIERRWDDIGVWLYVPYQKRQEIRSQHSTDSDRLRAVILYALTLHPRSSWRCIISALHWIKEHQVAKRIQDYSEPVTGMHIKDIYRMAGNFRGSQFSWFSRLTGDSRKLNPRNKKPKRTLARAITGGRGHRGACLCSAGLI